MTTNKFSVTEEIATKVMKELTSILHEQGIVDLPPPTIRRIIEYGVPIFSAKWFCESEHSLLLFVEGDKVDLSMQYGLGTYVERINQNDNKYCLDNFVKVNMEYLLKLGLDRHG